MYSVFEINKLEEGGWSFLHLHKTLHFISVSPVFLFHATVGYMRMVCWLIGLDGVNGRWDTEDDDVS